MQREGTLHIVMVNPATPHEVPEYHVGFADYQSGATRMKKVLGDETLKSFLSSGAGIPSQTVASAFERLRSESIANIFNVALTDDTLANLGL